MIRIKYAAAFLMFVFAGNAAASVILTTNQANNGLFANSGVYFDLTNLSDIDLTVMSITSAVNGDEGDAINASVWIRRGASTATFDFFSSNVGWDFQGPISSLVSGVSAGNGSLLAAFDLPDFQILGNSTVGIAFFTDLGVSYTNGAGYAPISVSDGVLTLTGFGAASASFSGLNYFPRVFSGSVDYSQVSEPITLALLGLGLLLISVSRRIK